MIVSQLLQSRLLLLLSGCVFRPCPTRIHDCEGEGRRRGTRRWGMFLVEAVKEAQTESWGAVA